MAEQSRESTVAKEALNQREELKKQRNLYISKSLNLKKELKLLKNQSEDLNSGYKNRLPSPKTQGFLNENLNLQSEIRKKLSTIENVIDMLSNIIGDKNNRKNKRRNADTSSSSSSSSSSGSSSESSSSDDSESEQKTKEKTFYDTNVNYVFFDPETHWCKSCKSFPKSAKDYLNHLHSEEHMGLSPLSDAPWHISQQDDAFPKNAQHSDKRVPIKGLQFFVPSLAWYCKLCNIWQGDLHCASIHLKSKTHFQNYNKFIGKNPSFEATWLVERQKELNIVNSSKSKNSSSENTVEDGSKSVRVTMRQVETSNKTDLQKISLKSVPAENKSDDLVSQWNPISSAISEDDKKILESVKNKYKQKESVSSRKKESNGRERDRSRKSRSPSRKRDRSRSRYSPDRYSRHYRRKYNSRSRSRSRGKYRSRSREIEKAIVPQFSTEFRPRVEKPKEKATYKKEDDRKKSPKKVIDGKTKKLPLIGKMPVFKKQTAKDDNVAPSNHLNVTSVIESSKKNTKTNSCTEFDDLMPDPVQFASLMAANNNMLPPGVDDADMDYNPMPNIDAPILPPTTKRPLHKDFEVALDIIFPDEEKKTTLHPTIDNEVMNQPLQFKVPNSEMSKNTASSESKEDDDLSYLGIDSGDTFFANF
ncbi:ZNF318 family protein [Megaselia abdita]